MKVTFQNIGAVQECTLDLTKDLSILCGPNNTGKTYIAYCLYGLLKLRTIEPFAFPRLKTDLQFVDGKATLDIPEHYKAHRSTIKWYIEKGFERSLSSIFGLDKDSTGKLFGQARVNVSIPFREETRQAMLAMSIKYGVQLSDGSVMDIRKKEGSPEMHFVIVTRPDRAPSELTTVPYSLIETLFEMYMAYLLPNTFIAPVERNSIFTFSKELAIQRNDLVDEMLRLKDAKGKNQNPMDLFARRAMRYPMPVRHGLDIAEDIATFKKHTSDFAAFADELESEVLGGKVLISKDGEVQFAPNKAKTLRLPMHVTASIVKSFSALIIYFRHLAAAGDFIIIDEPELNLHPDSQIMVARLIARIANEGFKVLISTHSDYIIRELNNLMMVDGLTKTQPEKVLPEPYQDPAIGLNPDTVGAYLFAYQSGKLKNKVMVEALDIDETGFEVSTIDRIIAELNSTSQELYFLLENEETEADAE